MMELNPQERRRGARDAADTDLTLVIDDPIPAEVRGCLIDVSRSGFRARHTYPRFEPGQRVLFRSAASQGLAQVIWNRILNERVETGFLLL